VSIDKTNVLNHDGQHVRREHLVAGGLHSEKPGENQSNKIKEMKLSRARGSNLLQLGHLQLGFELKQDVRGSRADTTNMPQ
jgi:hypothetical protein